MLVTMEATGKFPTEVPIFMHDEDCKESEDACKIIYIKPPPICGNCKSFGHLAGNCRYKDERLADNDIEGNKADQSATMPGIQNATIGEPAKQTERNEEENARGKSIEEVAMVTKRHNDN